VTSVSSVVKGFILLAPDLPDAAVGLCL
jgi:hypothetical protein